jgi:hypothetical protein
MPGRWTLDAGTAFLAIDNLSLPQQAKVWPRWLVLPRVRSRERARIHLALTNGNHTHHTYKFLSPQGSRLWMLSKRKARMIVKERKAHTGSLHYPPRQFVSLSEEGSCFVSGGFYTLTLQRRLCRTPGVCDTVGLDRQECELRATSTDNNVDH